MSKTLLSRIERLEQASIAKTDALTVILVDFTDAPLSGYRWKDEFIERRVPRHASPFFTPKRG